MILYRKMLGLMWEKLDAWTDVGGKIRKCSCKKNEIGTLVHLDMEK
jgi:hypothetical protein